VPISRLVGVSTTKDAKSGETRLDIRACPSISEQDYPTTFTLKFAGRARAQHRRGSYTFGDGFGRHGGGGVSSQ
jgi:hypothetical protein